MFLCLLTMFLKILIKPLREKGLQMGFIDTESDEYIAVLHKVDDKEKVIKVVNNIGYAYFDK